MDVVIEWFTKQHPVIAVVISVLGGLLLKGLPTLWNVAKGAYQFAKSIEKWANIPEQLASIQKELHTNGGSSLRDAVERTDRILSELVSVSRIYWDLSPDQAIFRADASGNYVWANPCYCAWLGRPLEDILGSNWELCVVPGEAATVLTAWRAAVDGKRRFEMAIHYQKTDGTTWYGYCIARPILANNQTVGWMGVVRKIEKNA